ncbi:hypothetical protein ACJX0J_030080, partial [Zea mays]
SPDPLDADDWLNWYDKDQEEGVSVIEARQHVGQRTLEGHPQIWLFSPKNPHKTSSEKLFLLLGKFPFITSLTKNFLFRTILKIHLLSKQMNSKGQINEVENRINNTS